jgi:threonine/homoserine/homoserine lactone efflux protein
MMHFLAVGTLLGLSAGLAPGPLLTLVIAETLQHDIRSGIKVALAPLITDLPIIILTLFILAKLADFQQILGIISLIGGVVIAHMGYQNLRAKAVSINPQAVKSNSFVKGVLANTLSPHPYLFWLSVGAPTMTKAIHQDLRAALAFILSFYGFLVGSKIVLAVLVGKSKFLLTGQAYLFTMRVLGLALCALAIVLFHDGLGLLKVL